MRNNSQKGLFFVTKRKDGKGANVALLVLNAVSVPFVVLMGKVGTFASFDPLILLARTFFSFSTDIKEP